MTGLIIRVTLGVPLRRICAMVTPFVVVCIGATTALASSGPEYWKNGEPVPNGSALHYTWSGGQLRWERAGTEQWECTSSTGEGEVLNSSEGRVDLTFHKCEWKGPFGIIACTSPGKSPGTVVTQPLQSHLYYGTPTTGESGRHAVNDLAPIEGTGVAQFACGPLQFEWRGSLLGAFEKVNSEQTTNSLIIRPSGGEQEYKEYETLEPADCSPTESTSDYLEESVGTSWEQIGLGVPDSLTFEEGLEVYAPCTT